MLRDRVCEAFGLDPLLAEQAGLVAVGAVAQDRDNVLVRAQLFGHLDSCDHVQGRGGAHVDTLLVQQAVDHLERFGIWDLQCVVDQLDVGLQVLGDTALTDTLSDGAASTLNKRAAALDVRVQNTAGRISQEDLGLAVALLLQVPGNTAQGTASACGAGESVDLAVQLLPDLGSSGLDMGTAVGGVVELVGPDGVLEALGMAGSLVVVVLGVVERHGGDGVHFGACF